MHAPVLFPRREILATAIGLLLSLGPMIAPAQVASNAGAGVQRLRCEYQETPLAIETPNPRLSWWFVDPRNGARQTAYQVRVASRPEALQNGHADLWDSGRIESDETVNNRYIGKPLLPAARAWWAVRAWDAHGVATAWSPPSYWQQGLDGTDAWLGSWIRMKSMPPVSHEAVDHWIRFGIGREASPAARAWFQEAMKPAPCFRNEFSLDKKPERATLYVAALGYSEWFLNGKRIGDRVLDPAYQEYDRQIYYVAYDVTEDLRAGKNALGAVLGNGWFNQRGQFFGTAKSKFYTYEQDLGNPGIRVQLVLQYGNQTEHVVSDASWRCAYGPLLRNELFLGEVYDARLEHTGWNEARFDDRNWTPVETAAPPPARLKAMTCAPERRVREIPAISIAEPAPGIYVADLGETIAGWPKIRVREKSGTVIAVRPSPFLRNRPEFMAGRALPYPDPALDRKIISNMIGGELTAQPPDVDGKERSQFHGCDLYITRGGGEETFQRHFSYCGFRYVELIGLSHRPGPQDILGVVVHSDLPRTATFRCSDEKVNELYASMEKTLRYVTHGLVNDNTDAEKNAMRGHQAMAGDFLAYAWNDPMFWEKAIRDIRLQTVGEGDLEGLPPTKAPAPRYFHRGGGGLRPYVDTIYEAVRALRFTDNRALAEEHFPWMMKFLRLFHRRVIDPRLLRTTQELGGGGLYVAGDRLDVCRVEPRPHFADAASSRPEVVERCLFLLAVQETREVAQVLGKHAEQKELEDMAGRISETIRNLGYDGNLKTFGSQAENAMALRTGVVPPPRPSCGGREPQTHHHGRMGWTLVGGIHRHPLSSGRAE